LTRAESIAGDPSGYGESADPGLAKSFLSLEMFDQVADGRFICLDFAAAFQIVNNAVVEQRFLHL
jgi:hypothetical protein